MKPVETYSKKISSEEETEGYFLILKNRLSFFPPVGRTFQLVKDGSSYKAKVESYPCTCRGPEDPHEHFFVRSKGLRTGDRIEVWRHSVRTARYCLHLHRRHSP